jgi:hypothetical protein
MTQQKMNLLQNVIKEDVPVICIYEQPNVVNIGIVISKKPDYAHSKMNLLHDAVPLAMQLAIVHVSSHLTMHTICNDDTLLCTSNQSNRRPLHPSFIIQPNLRIQMASISESYTSMAHQFDKI